jgi:hypothetical protein
MPLMPVGYTLHPEQVTLAGPDGQPIAGEGDGEVVARGRYLERPVAEQVTTLQDAPWQFWRGPDNRLRLTIAVPLAAGDPQAEHDERVWVAVQACGEFLASPWREAPYARTWGVGGFRPTEAHKCLTRFMLSVMRSVIVRQSWKRDVY